MITILRDDELLESLQGATLPSQSTPGAAYRIIGRAAVGAIFTSFYAVRVAPEGDCPVVVKVLRPSFSRQLGPNAAVVVKKEAVSLGRLNERVPPTPFVVRLIDTGTVEVQRGLRSLSLPWITIEYVHGGAQGATLRERVRRTIQTTGHAFDPSRAMRAIECIASGLAAVHEVGVVHRDLTPDSILCSGAGDDEIMKISDFGLAKPQGVKETLGIGFLHAEGIRPPELVVGATGIGPWTDMFSFACVIYFILTGEPLVAAQAGEDLLSAVGSRSRRSILEGRWLHPDLRAQEAACKSIDFALRWATAPTPDERLQEAESLAAMLVPYLRPAAAAPILAQSPGVPPALPTDTSTESGQVPSWMIQTIQIRRPVLPSSEAGGPAGTPPSAMESAAGPRPPAPATPATPPRAPAPSRPDGIPSSVDPRASAPSVPDSGSWVDPRSAPAPAAPAAAFSWGTTMRSSDAGLDGAEVAGSAPIASAPSAEELEVEVEVEVEPAPRKVNALATTRPSESHAGGRWAWSTLRHPGTVGVLRSLAWDGYGRCLAATNEGLLFWNGMGWCAIPSSSLPRPDGVRFVHKIGPGRWLVGGDASMLAAYTTGGLAGIIQRPGAPEQYIALSGDAEDMGVLAAVPQEGPILLRTFVGKRWLRPCSVGGVAHFAGLARVEDESWLLACRTGGGRGMLALYSPLEWHLERLPAPDVRAYIACTGAAESDLGLAVGTEGTAVWCVERRAVAEVVDSRFDLSAVALGGDGSAWAASAGRIWRRAPATPGAGVWEGVWGDDAWVAPVISLFVDFGVVVAVTADGGILEGRLV